MRVPTLFDRLNIRFDSPVFRGFESLIPFWLESIGRVGTYNSDLVAQAVLFYTLSYIAEHMYVHGCPEQQENIIDETKRYILNSVAQIDEASGCNDPLYFSRI